VDALHYSAEKNADVATAEPSNVVLPFTRTSPKIGRNDPCNCGSGKKYKHCHGRLE